MPKTAPLHHMAASITTQPQPPSGGSGAAALPGQPGLPGASAAARGWAPLSPLPGHHSPPFSRRGSSTAGGSGRGVTAAGSPPAPCGSSCSLTGAIPGAGVRPSRRAAPALLLLLLLPTSRPPPASAPDRGGCGHPAAPRPSLHPPVCGTQRGQLSPPVPAAPPPLYFKRGAPSGASAARALPSAPIGRGRGGGRGGKGREEGREGGRGRAPEPRFSPGPPRLSRRPGCPAEGVERGGTAPCRPRR